MAQLFAKHFRSIDALAAASLEEMQGIPGVGPEIAGGVHAWFQEPQNRALLEKFQRAGIRMSDKELAQKIATEPFFQVDGRFNKERYEQLARAQNLTPAGLDERLRGGGLRGHRLER